MYVIFRAVNFTSKSDESLAECETVYIEMQFTETQRKCQNNPDLRLNNEVIKVTKENPYQSVKLN